MKISSVSISAALALLGLAQLHGAETVLFQDDFEGDSASKWSTFQGSGNGTPDSTVEFGVIYTNINVTINGVAGKIPLAPGGTGGKGVKMTVNKDDVADAAGVNIYAKDQMFMDDYAFRFAMWINYNGPAFGGTGSTEFGIFGINHNGTQVNWAPPAAAPLPASDGLWFAVTGEGGAAGDFRTYEGDAANSPLRYTGIDGGFLDRNGDSIYEQEIVNTALGFPWPLIFRAPPGETPGAPGKRWMDVEIRQVGGVVTWVMNGYVIAELTNPGTWTMGTVMLGTMDIFASIADPKADNFVIFDNVRVVQLSGEARPRLTLTSTEKELTEGGSALTVTLTRSGDLTQPLNVFLSASGTATPQFDYRFPVATNFPAGVTTLEVPIPSVNDEASEPDETIILSILHNQAQYEVFAPSIVEALLKDDGDVTKVSVIPLRHFAYEDIQGEDAAFLVTHTGATNVDYVVNFTVAGTAQAGGDYNLSVASPVTIPAGSHSAIVEVIAIPDASAEDPETVVLTIDPGTGYVPALLPSATVAVREAGAPDFMDDFNTDTSANWTVLTEAANNIQDYRAGFAYDYSQSALPIPALPNATDTKALLLTVNKNDATGSGATVNVYPKNQTFSENVVLKFNMFLNFITPPTGTTESSIFGINHSGAITNRHNKAGSDGVWFAVESDGSAQGGRSYVVYHPVNTTAVPALDARHANTLTEVFPNPPFLAAGAAAGQWVDVTVRQEHRLVTWDINGVEILRWPNTNMFTSGTIMLGHMDSFNSVGSTNNLTLFDNVRVWNLDTALPPASVLARQITVNNGTVSILFNSNRENASGFSVESSATVNGTFAPEPNVTITPDGLRNGRYHFFARFPVTTPAKFFRIRYNE